MDMHAAALPPRQPAIRKSDRAHPLFPIYEQHRSACARLLIEASEFSDWKFQYERDIQHQRHAAHPKYPEFIQWMGMNQGGARKCPAGDFPRNFIFWLDGGRW